MTEETKTTPLTERQLAHEVGEMFRGFTDDERREVFNVVRSIHDMLRGKKEGR